jgi:L-lactate permease
VDCNDPREVRKTYVITPLSIELPLRIAGVQSCWVHVGAGLPYLGRSQSIVVASTATNWFGHEGTILRFVFGHSIVLACMVGILVMLQAYVFTGMIVH